jgi:hypothetical protein
MRDILSSILHIRGARILRKTISPLKIVGARKLTWSHFHTVDPQILGATVQNVVATATWDPGFVHPNFFLESSQRCPFVAWPNGCVRLSCRYFLMFGLVNVQVELNFYYQPYALIY